MGVKCSAQSRYAPGYARDEHFRASLAHATTQPCGFCVSVRPRKAHTGFEPVLPENAVPKPDSGSKGRIAAGNELNPHLRAVLERLKERDRSAAR